ncbi:MULTISPECIES: N-acetylglucosamine kinase [Capnocytophaga]|uniref:N-acetylglucosamine kinase n=1 Tax=Capnocytophaga canis TaxID=1848903 RepID=A0A0B7IIZ6_9FLAO|nr:MULTISPECIES: N-acetylglucosamine kinase [Capnocytophaga]ATA71979.1 N-acetylglucosamine kinase [Capnocytophaga sp. H4358]ATA74097.1 N-acetylglucosamine kinase [Capnocytophaga sp. H2931]RIY37345.1 N-acetylglucosamine kinase [Capnocytophaga canis]CEN45343.1 N-acetylglucosamine kinase-like protein [Capnocytophaga canis]CEN49361.1 N-acetylglucosamine kinase-like protein [Capnocytophaga canis]
MILIVDSGATKADWTALNDKGEQLFFTQTLGLNPEVLTEELIIERITTNNDLFSNKDKVTGLYFYGAGCGTERMTSFMARTLQTIFRTAKIDVKEDTFAAVYATTRPEDKAIVCILGTGANCSYWNGEKLVQAVDSLGYILMDESSGNFYGKRLVTDYFFNKMPKELAQKFEKEYDLNSDVIKNHLYKLPNPNSYLATFAKFIVENKEHDYCRNIVRNGVQLFVDHWISQYEARYEVPINFVGSIAFYLQDILKEVLTENNLKLGNVLRKPIDGLVAFHVNKVK